MSMFSPGIPSEVNDDVADYLLEAENAIESSAVAVADHLRTVASNGEEQTETGFLVVEAKNLKRHAQGFIDEFGNPQPQVVYHAAYTRDGFAGSMSTTASTDKQEVYENIWDALARDWMSEYDYDDSHETAQVIQEALDNGDYKTAVETYPFHKGPGGYTVDTIELDQ